MRTKLLSFIVIIMVGIFLILIWFFKQPCEEWKKPENVPISAVWKGGCDGGNWMEMVAIKSDTIRLRIYSDWDGELILDADFVSTHCNNLHLTTANWSKYITFFDGENIYTNIQISKRYCYLTPVMPVYYEIDYQKNNMVSNIR